MPPPRRDRPVPARTGPRGRVRSPPRRGGFRAPGRDDPPPAGCASGRPPFTPADGRKPWGFTPGRRSLDVAPLPVVPADPREVAQHGRRIRREAHAARLVVVAVLD